MRKISGLIFVFMLLVVTVLYSEEFDLVDSQKYLLFEANARLRITDKSGIDSTRLKYLTDSISSETNIKSTIYNENNIEVYINIDNFDLDFLEFEVPYANVSNNCEEHCFISTVNTKDLNQIGLIKDFKNNHRYKYFSIDDLGLLGNPMFLDYDIYFGNTHDRSLVQNMIDSGLIKAEIIEPLAVSTNDQTKAHSKTLIYILILLSIILVSNIIYEYYNRSREIGVMRMLGIKDWTMLIITSRPTLMLFGIGSLVSIVYAVFIGGGFSLGFVSTIITFLVNLFLILVVVTIFSHFFLIKSISIVSSIKNNKSTAKLLVMSSLIKLVAGVLIIGSTSLIASHMRDLITIKNENQQFSTIFNVVQFEGLGNPEAFEKIGEYEYHIRSLNFYKEISNSNIDTVFSDFSRYFFWNNRAGYEQNAIGVTEEEIRAYEEHLLKNGILPEAIVDKNYLIKYGVVAYTDKGELVDWNEDLESYIILLPKDKSNTEEFLKYTYESGFVHEYNKWVPKKMDFNVYYYENMELPTLHPFHSETMYIDSPDMFVLDINTISDYNDFGPLIFNRDGGLKFFASDRDNKVNLFNRLEPYLVQSGVSEFYDLSYFLSYGDEFGQISKKVSNQINDQSKIVVIFSFVYLIVSFQLNAMLFEYYYEEITVKLFLGYTMRQAVGKIILINWSCLLLSSFYLLIQGFNVDLLIGMLFLFLIEGLSLVTYFWIISKNKIYNGLKGDQR